MMDEVIPESRSSRDFRVKYPEDLIQDGLAGQLWFGAEVNKIMTYFRENFKNTLLLIIMMISFDCYNSNGMS